MATGDKKPVVMAADMDVANGVATLGADAKLNDSQIPMQKIMAVTNAAEYSQTQTYALGAYCTRGGKLYKCTTAITSAETWTEAHWTETTVGAELVAVIVALTAKAPAGYGLGGTFGDYIADADNATVDGKYRTNSGTLNLPDGVDGMFGVIDVTTIRPDKALLQKFCPGTDGYPPYSLERRRIVGIWKPWEWVNPPMQIGVEYRTTERYKNKPVYVNVVNCGEFATGATKRVAHGITMDSVVRAFGVRSNGESIPMTYTSNGTSYERINFMVGTSNVFITSENTASTGTLVVQIYYTKATD